jgi:type IV pilus assembly protein PilM
VKGEFLQKLRLRRASDVFGLDIGSTAIKVVQLHSHESSYSLSAYASVPLPAGVVAEGTISDPAAAVEAIKTAVTKAGVSTTDAAIGICGRELIIKKLQIPEVPPKELADAVQLEAEHQIPFAIDDVFLDYHVVGQQNRLIDLALVAAKKSKVMEYFTVVQDAGLDPVVVDVDGFALGNQFELTDPDEGSLTAIVDLGATMMKVSIVRGGLTLFVRDVPFGGNRYTQALAARLSVPFEKAEAIKVGRDHDDVDAEAVTRVRDAVSRDLALELQRTFDYFASTSAADRIGKMLLAGGSARLTGLADYLSATFGVPVEVAHPFAGIEVDPGYAGEIATAGPSLAVAVGLSLRQAGDGGHA